ncbi:MAG: hypothetical protein JST87_05635 [Bacteroidetes bacterium]|nr:hypothetical protein [Bacteroidota bacterium]
MDAVIPYLLKSFLISGAFTIYYWLVLRNRKFNHYNRFYLLFTIAASLGIPFINFRLYSVKQPHNNLATIVLKVIGATGTETGDSGFSWEYILPAAAFLISFILVILLLAQIKKVNLIKRKYPCISINGVDVFLTDLDEAPFSFGNNLFWNKSVDMHSEEGRLIVEHEMAHILGKHTYDTLISQFAARIFWMNPFFTIIQKELSLVQEFIADEKAIKGNDPVMFARMLLQSHNEGRYLEIEHSFFHSPIKRRLFMISISPEISYSFLRKICTLPLVLIILLIFSISVSNAQTDSTKNTDSSQQKKIEAERKANPFNQFEPGYAPDAEEIKKLCIQIVTNPPTNRIYFVNGEQVPISKVKQLKYEAITDMQLLPPEDALKKFSVTGEKGVIVFLTKK